MWRKWDKTPSNVYATNRLVDTVIAVAEHFDVPSLQVRIIMARWRREGLTHRQAVERLFTLLGEPTPQD